MTIDPAPMKVIGIRVLYFAAVPVALLACWQLASGMRWFNPVFLPPPTRVLRSLVALLADGSLVEATLLTTGRALLGLAVAVATAVPLGILVASSPVFDDLTRPGREFLRALPTVTIVPALMVVLGVGTGLSITVVAFGALWPILLGTVHGVREIDPTLVDVGRVHRLGPLATAVRIRLPAALAEIVTGIRVSLAIALVIALVAEMMTGSGGLGALVIEARSRFRSADVFAIVAAIGVVGFVLNALMMRIETRSRH